MRGHPRPFPKHLCPSLNIGLCLCLTLSACHVQWQASATATTRTSGTAPTATTAEAKHAFTAGQAKAEPKPVRMEIVVDDLTDPKVLSFGADVNRAEVTLRCSSLREIFAQGHGVAFSTNGGVNWGNRINSARVDGRLVIHLSASSARKSPWTVAVHGRETRPQLEPKPHGKPADDAPLAERQLERYIPYFYYPRYPLTDYRKAVAWLFAHLDDSFFVYAKADYYAIKAGEPLLYGPEGLIRANGTTHGTGNLQDLSTKRPAQVKLPIELGPPSVKPMPPHFMPAVFVEEEFRVLSDKRPRIKAYLAHRARALQCAQAQWRKLDPHGRAGSYNIVTYRGGKVAKVESYQLKLAKKVRRACKLERLLEERESIRAAIRQEEAQASAAGIQAARQRFQ